VKWFYPITEFGDGIECYECNKKFIKGEIGVLIGENSNEIELKEDTCQSLLCMSCVKDAYDMVFWK
jgi:hypothetical protein